MSLILFWHQSSESILSFLNLWSQKTFENELNAKWAFSLLLHLNKTYTSNSSKTLCRWAWEIKIPVPIKKLSQVTPLYSKSNQADLGEKFIPKRWDNLSTNFLLLQANSKYLYSMGNGICFFLIQLKMKRDIYALHEKEFFQIS